MFWKKKKALTEPFSYASNDKRESFRYEFKDGNGFDIEFRGRIIRVINVSAGGIAFKNKNFEPLDSDLINFQLEIPDYSGDTTFSAELRILKIDKKNICHCIFEQCSLEQHELIHRYVLEMQKNDLAH